MNLCCHHELCILMLDNDCGSMRTLPAQPGDLGLAAAVLLDLPGRIQIRDLRDVVAAPLETGMALTSRLPS